MSHFRLPRRITAPVTLPRVVAMVVIAVGVLSFGSIGSAASTSLVINEVDYDQPATDTAEFYELKNVSGAAINLDAYRVELINGNGGALYQVHDLPNVNLAAGDYFVVCANAANTANCDMDVTPDTDLIQNGAPDGLRLMLGLDPTPVDALSYEGDTLGATEGSGAGLNDTAAAAPAVAESISRCPDGADADVNNADFSLRTSSPGAANVCAGPKVVINEVDYDQPGTDTAEFLELKNTSAVAVNLDPYAVELVNGSGGLVYGTIDLPAVSLAGGDYYVICADAATTVNCDLDVTPDSNLIQNGAPDGLRLVLAGTTVDALSYEGDTAGATEGSGTGLEDLAGDGLSRCPDGNDTDANNVDFSLRAITPGATNSCAAPKVVVNEVDYDQVGTDAAEYLELKNTSGVAVNLDPYVVELVNGSGGAVYGTFDLPAVSLAGGDYYVICANAATVPNCDLDVDPNTDRIQNGSPDGIRLLLAGATVDALSYEGDTLGSTEGTGTTAADSNTEAGIGLSRCADGADTGQQQRRLRAQGDHAWCDERVRAAAARPGRQLRRAGDADPRRPGQRRREPARRHRRSRSRASSSATTRAAGEFGGYYLQEEAADADADPLHLRGRSSSSAAPASTTSARATSSAFAAPSASSTA